MNAAERDRSAPDLGGHFDADHLVQDGRIWYLRQRVPTAVKAYDLRREIYVSTCSADRGVAMVIAQRINRELEDYWRSLVQADKAGDAAKRLQAAIKTARRLGITFQPATEVAP